MSRAVGEAVGGDAPWDAPTAADGHLPLPRVDLRADQGVPGAAFIAGAVERRLFRIQRRPFPIEKVTYDQLGELGASVELSDEGGGQANLLLHLEDGPIGLLTVQQGQAWVAVAAPTREEATRRAEGLADALRAPERPVPDDFVPVTFWSLTAQGPRPLRRDIRTPAWSEIDANYAPPARASLAKLMEAREPGGGRLIIWQGSAGTGKAYALRALARAWKNWCDVNVVVDPEVFFGHQTSYLMDVLFAAGQQPGGAGRARLLVLEDSGELLSADAREHTGQALSRLLNVSDGLLGQGLDLCTLITTNEPIERFHPAVRRPGRCWAQIEFPPLSADDSNAWLEARESTARVEAATTLAALFAADDSASASS